jgi:site-specific DNA recombinase
MDLENIFHQKTRQYFANPAKLASHLAQSVQNLKEKEALCATHQQAIQKTREEMAQVMELYKKGQISVNRFGEFFQPVEDRLKQLETELPKLQADVDLLKVNRLSKEDILAEAILCPTGGHPCR